MQYTALGSPVNLASRVENMNKRFFTEMLVTGPVEEVVRGQFLFRPLGLVVATGTTAPVQLFELLVEVGQEAPAKLAPWLEAFAPFQKGDWDQAVVTLQAFLEAFPGDQPARLLRDRALANAAAPDKAEAALYFRDK
jgi:adenylate cyclase